MSVAVVIVNYNAGSWLRRSVQSALNSSDVDAVFVVDNASQDNSIASLKEFENDKKLNIILNKENVGFGPANNQILNKVVNDASDKQFDYVLLLNPDCELANDVLPVMLDYFAKEEKLGLASCLIKNSNGSIQQTCRRKFPTPWTAFLRLTQLQKLGFAKDTNFDLGEKNMPEKMELVEAISGAFMLVRTKAMKEVGTFDEDYFMHCEDLDWCKRFELSDWNVGFIPEVSVLHEKGVSSKSRPVGVLWNLHSGMLRFFKKFYKDESPLYLRLIVPLGIYANFVLKASLSLVSGLWNK